ncbi:MAG: hypothetical protein Q8911_01525 [Bacillota bacterium]|nr:hypothetical protein [Bacillota bacterium]
MGVQGQFALSEVVGTPNPPFPSVRMAELFYEFLGRYQEWKTAKLKELIWMQIALCLGLSCLFTPLFLPRIWMIMSLVILGLFFFVMRHYLEVNERVNHLHVNVYILHHHLIGKLEVGFCDHTEPCQCVENFRNYVLKHYGISLDKRSLT